ncbi:MAG: hypothetical protein NWR72_20740 [Bacteroidia bacterium]|nr:hypothetical protein [Bacteroidia bacterium]
MNLNTTFSPVIAAIGRSSTMWVTAALLLVAWMLASRSLGDTDQGFVQGLAWRVWQGEHIYQDFDYVRPPLTPWLHSIWFLFGDCWLLFGRMSMVILLAASVRFQLLFFKKTAGLGWPLAAGILCFLVALHTFPAMPWHTVDGLFFASAGFFLLSKNRRMWRLLGWVCLLGAAMCKQSFFPVPIMGLAWLLLDRGWNKGLAEGALWLGATVVAGLAWAWQMPGSPDLLWSWVGSSGSSGDLWEVGIKGYLLPVGPAALILLLRWGQNRIPLLSWAIILLLAGALAFWAAKVWITGASQMPPFRLGHVLWWVAVVEALRLTFARKKEGYAWLALLGLAWCTSISWGYATPILAATPLLWTFFRQEYHAWKNAMIPVLLLPAFALVVAGWLFPYREINDFSGPSQELASYYPALRYVATGPAIKAELLEIAAIRDRYPGAFTILPNWPLIHALLGEQNPAPIDWAHNAEMKWEEFPQRYVEPLGHCHIVIVDKDQLSEADDSGKYGSALLRYVLDHGVLLEETKHFQVFGSIGKTELY